MHNDSETQRDTDWKFVDGAGSAGATAGDGDPRRERVRAEVVHAILETPCILTDVLSRLPVSN